MYAYLVDHPDGPFNRIDIPRPVPAKHQVLVRVWATGLNPLDTMREAGALPLVTITGWEGLVDRARVRAGQTVLVHAGAGGVGHIAVQLAMHFGAQVFATVSPEKEAIVRSFGATSIDYRSQSVEHYVDCHTAGEGFDIIYDTVGGKTHFR